MIRSPEAWSVDNGLLTPTLKLKRPLLLQRLGRGSTLPTLNRHRRRAAASAETRTLATSVARERGRNILTEWAFTSLTTER